MAQSRQAIQARISSVSSTKKITKAMQLIASSKLTRQRQIMEENRSYAQGLQELFTMVHVFPLQRPYWSVPVPFFRTSI